MNDQLRPADILMILPKRTILKAEPLENDWVLDQDPAGLSLFIHGKPAGYASWQNASDFGMHRPSVFFSCLEKGSRKLAVFEALVSRLAIAFDRIPGRYPLYIKLQSTDLDLIAKASRMGFIPYFGEWSQKTSEQSESCWKGITESLRHRYPEGLSC